MNAITSATTKSELVEMLKKVSSKVKKADAKLAEEVKYATSMFAKDPSKVTKKDLLTLIAESNKALAIPASADTKKKESTPTPAPTKEKPKASLKKKAEEPKVENLIKPAKKSADKKEEPKAEEKKAPAKEKKETAPAKEKAEKKPVSKKAEVKPIPDFKFPETLEIEEENGTSTYTLAKVKDMKSLCKAIEKGDKSYVFAFHFTAKDLKTIYPVGLPRASAYKSFTNDLDVTIPLYVSPNEDLIHTVSLYTEVMYTLVGDDEIEEVEGSRYSLGLAYQIYVEA